MRDDDADRGRKARPPKRLLRPCERRGTDRGDAGMTATDPAQAMQHGLPLAVQLSAANIHYSRLMEPLVLSNARSLA